ncbi:hypothetical protein TNIN_6131, partial [Trichonephila inaurata madagascariensis]
ERQLSKEKHKILFLVIDNYKVHPEIIKIGTEFLPSSSTSVIQSIDQAVIRSFELNLRNHLILMLLDKREKIGTPLRANVNVLEGILLMNDVENHSSRYTTNCFCKIGLETSQERQFIEEDVKVNELENLVITRKIENYVSVDANVIISEIPTPEKNVDEIQTRGATDVFGAISLSRRTTQERDNKAAQSK